MPADPFERLGIPRRFAIDRREAEEKHLALSRALHPDKQVGASPPERRAALSLAIEVNEAWRVVRDPIKRAEAILQLSGLEGEVGETREPKPSGGFLMEVMESREALEEARASKERAAVEAVVVSAKKQREDVEGELASRLDAALALPEVERLPALRATIPLLGRLRYAARLLSEANTARDEIDGF